MWLSGLMGPMVEGFVAASEVELGGWVNDSMVEGYYRIAEEA